MASSFNYVSVYVDDVYNMFNRTFMSIQYFSRFRVLVMSVLPLLLSVSAFVTVNVLCEFERNE